MGEKLRAVDLIKTHGITRHEAYRLARLKKIPHARVSKMIIFDKDDLDAWYEKRKVKVAET